ncbi:MAG: serine/threonine-protein kinase, partial [Polyangiaceae bacterium]
MEPLAPEDLVDDWSDLSTSSLGAGAQLGRYELLLPVAYGGMARVWAARMRGQRGFSKLVAIKTILPHLAHNAEFERMFLDEARIAAGVHHHNVTEIYELGEEGHVLYLAMEWVNGESLVHVARGLDGKTPLALDTRLAARIAADACAGLHAAHELTDEAGQRLNVVHRDVSPHNILVALDGTVKVTDFGVAKALGQSHQQTVAGQIKGKVAYMAPEVLSGTAFDRRTDIFAMGCVLYEAATGRLPFRGASDPLVMQAVLRGAYEPPPTVIRGFPLELAGVIDRALASDPRRRFATAEQMRVALEEWLARSGPLVAPSDVGRLVRERVGAHLEHRREHVRAAMASAGEGDAPR